MGIVDTGSGRVMECDSVVRQSGLAQTRIRLLSVGAPAQSPIATSHARHLSITTRVGLPEICLLLILTRPEQSAAAFTMTVTTEIKKQQRSVSEDLLSEKVPPPSPLPTRHHARARTRIITLAHTHLHMHTDSHLSPPPPLLLACPS